MVVGEVAVETDVVVIGGGPGGYAAAIRLGQLGKSVVLVEKEQLGGVCLNRGCIPSKSLIHAASEFSRIAGLSKMGIRLPEEKATFEMIEWQEWKNSVVSQLNKGVGQLCEENGVTVVYGTANFLSADRLGVETGNDFETFKFQQAIIATGARPFVPTILQRDGIHILDSTDILQLEEIPQNLAIIGGGYIGMELGMAFAKLGTAVTVIEATGQILPQLPTHLVREVNKNNKKLGIMVKTSTKVESAVIKEGQVELRVTSEKAGSENHSFNKVLVTIGRIPNTEELGLEQAGVKVDDRGYIHVDSAGRTEQSHIFAIGDVTPGPAMAHRATKQGIVAAEVIAGLSSSAADALVPFVIFTEPQIAGVGLTRDEAKEQGYNASATSFPYRANGRALATDEAEGFAEIIMDVDNNTLLGMFVVGADASNLIGEGVFALEMAARAEDLALIMHPHPTLSEIWQEAAEGALGHAIHMMNKK
ncbi:dihydrolipoyl dehydrogenase [Brevibacillus daliensis]|uniref:dihydrolipoyl dehydrogenase n=1 Tax=Brevibacillus daliensis TaxID=2892995 RepID=UPI001E64BC6C|nr:dihydrolipoyl dehydrogenase [Brevibacillus daliensis]